MSAPINPDELTGGQVRKIREQYRLTREMLASLLDWNSPSRVQTVELGNFRSDDRERIAELFSKITAHEPAPKKRGDDAAKLYDRIMSMPLTAQAEAETAPEKDDDSPTLVLPDPQTGDVVNWAYDQTAGSWVPVAETPVFVIPDGLVVNSPDDEDLDGGYGEAVPYSALISARIVGERATVRPSGEPEYVGHSQTELDALAGIAEVQEPVAISEPTPMPTKIGRVISQSEVGTWQRCRRKWYFTYNQNLGEKITLDYLMNARSVGTRIHAALAGWYVPDGEKPVDPRTGLEEAIAADWATIAEGMPEDQWHENWDHFSKSLDLERAVIEGYVQHIEENGLDANIKIIASEQAIDATIPVDVDGEIVNVQLVALLDVRAIDTRTNSRIFIDHKSFAEFATHSRVLHMDQQMLFYMLLEWMNSAPEERTATALFNMLRKVKRTANAKPPFYDRREVTHNPVTIESFRIRTVGAVRDIIRTERQLADGADDREVAYPTWNTRCPYDCPFFSSVCPSRDNGEDWEAQGVFMFDKINPMERYDGKGV